MAHFESLLNVPGHDDSADAHLFDVNLPDLPSADAYALHSSISQDAASAAIQALSAAWHLICMACAQSSSLMQLRC